MRAIRGFWISRIWLAADGVRRSGLAAEHRVVVQQVEDVEVDVHARAAQLELLADARVELGHRVAGGTS